MEKSRKKSLGFIDKAITAANSMRREELLFSYKGILYPTTICSPETFKALESFEARRDDVILAGYPKSGTNCLSQILTDLITISQKKTPGSESSGNAEEQDVISYLEVGDAEKYERMTKLPSPRFMVTHLCPENLPKSIFQNNAKFALIGPFGTVSTRDLLGLNKSSRGKMDFDVISCGRNFMALLQILLLIRNPKDVATSFYHFSNGLPTLPSYETWDDFFTDFMTKKMAWGCYFEYLSDWNKYADKENIITITYEEIKENPSQVVKNIATFFGIPLTEEQFQLVVERSSFQSMKKNSDKTHGAFGNILFRKGGVSDWKNLFSEEQSKKMDKAFEEHIAGTKLGKKLKYDLYCKT